MNINHPMAPRPLATRRRSALAGRHAAAAFTLLELVIVILIVGIIAAAAQPRFAGALANYRVDAAAHRLAADLGYASSMARVSSRPVIVRFFTDGDGNSHYRFDRLGDPHVPGRPSDSTEPSTWYTVRLHEEPYESQWVEMPEMIEFDIYGLPDRDAQWVLRCGSRQRTVHCVRSTGKASVL